MLQLSDSICYSLHTLKHNIKGVNGEEHHINNQGYSIVSNITTRIITSKRRIWKLIFIMSIDVIGGERFFWKTVLHYRRRGNWTGSVDRSRTLLIPLTN
jgi:hypothetical protein